MSLAAAVGAGLVVLTHAVIWVAPKLFPCRAEGWGCLTYALNVAAIVVATAAIIAWPLLRLVGVRPAYLVALGGLPATFAIGWFWDQVFRSSPTASHRLLIVTALGYGIAALVTAREVGWIWRIGGIGAVAALVPLAGFVTADRADRYFERELRRAGMPLLAPDLPGYRVEYAHADPVSRALRYSLVPRSLPRSASDYERAGSTISVTVWPVSARFAPPGQCATHDRQDAVSSCTPVESQVWRQSRAGPSVAYLVRRGDVLVILEQGGDHISEDVLRRAATSLSPRPAGHFAPGSR